MMPVETTPAGGDYEVENRGPVRILRITRPERSNALSMSLWDGLADEFLAAAEDSRVRVIVVTGEGDKAFCAGADLKEIREKDLAGTAFRPPMNLPRRQLFEVITETFKPTIAAMNGAAVAGGFELALACDLRVAVKGIQMGVPEAKVGMGANFAAVVLPKRLPLGLALEMLYTGEYISAETAQQWGLVNRIVEREQLMPEVMALAEKIASNAPLSVRSMKEKAIKGLELPLWQALRLDVGPNPYRSEDRIEGIAARLEKRKPVWRGR